MTDSETDQYRILFEKCTDAMLIIDDDRFVDCNDATLKMLGYNSREALFSIHPSELSPPFQPDGRESHAKADEMIAIAFSQGSHRFEWVHRRANGTDFPVEVVLTAIPLEDKTILHVGWRDITAHKHALENVRKSEIYAQRKAAEELTLGNLLRLSLQNLTMANYLQHCIKELLISVPWLNLLPSGGIFLIHKEITSNLICTTLD